MPLSEDEQRILDEIERRLVAEDPKFARTTSTVTPRGVAVKRIKRACFMFAGGLAFLLAGLVIPDMLVLLGLVGFAVMLGAVVVIATAMKGVARVPTAPAPTGDAPSWFERFEDRWRKRFERDDGAP